MLRLDFHSRISTKCPAHAAAAAMAGRRGACGRLCLGGLRSCDCEVDAQRSPGASLSGFIARHMLQPASRHSKPASLKMRSRPSFSACCFTSPLPGTTIALTWPATLWPLTTAAAARRSSMRAFVQEPMNTRSSFRSQIGVAAGEAHVFERAGGGLLFVRIGEVGRLGHAAGHRRDLAGIGAPGDLRRDVGCRRTRATCRTSRRHRSAASASGRRPCRTSAPCGACGRPRR